MHLFSGPIDIEAHVEQAQAERPSVSAGRSSLSDLEQRVASLEAEVAEIREQLKTS
jgi:uncharacterized protein YceH (UPF0502 family)